MKRIRGFAILSVVLALTTCGFAADVYAFTKDRFTSATADDYAVCAGVDAQYDDDEDKWSADVNILVSNTGEVELTDIPLRVVTWVSILKRVWLIKKGF